MNSTTLKALIISKLETETGDSFTAKQIEQITPLCLAIASAVVEHIQSTAVVTVAAPIPVTTVPATGVGGTTAPGTGSIT